MKVKGFLKDISGIFRIKKIRKTKIDSSNPEEVVPDRIAELAKSLHPGKIKAVVSDIASETKDAKRITFSSKDIPYFRAGNYLTVELPIGPSVVTRPYSIVTSPMKAYKEKIVEIIVKDYKDGFVSHYLTNSLRVGDEVILEVGLGFFNYEEFRDSKNIMALVGGIGITPFISMAHDIVERKLDINLTIIYGSDNPKEIIAKDELEKLVQDNIKVVHVISGKYPWNGEKGFINKDIIRRYSPVKPTYFICGPKVMYEQIIKELSANHVDLRRIRYEPFPIEDITSHPDFPLELKDQEFEIEVHQGTQISRIRALARESIATSLERSGLRIHTCCRAGACGSCRIKVLSGSYFIPPEYDHRRATDKEFDYVHSCSTYPTSNLKIKINILKDIS